jgi:hypothetical protein
MSLMATLTRVPPSETVRGSLRPNDATRQTPIRQRERGRLASPEMRTRILLGLTIVVLLAALSPAPASGQPATRRGGGASTPDGWIKLCGQSLNCAIDPLPHPWLGRNVYNTSGRHQTEKDRIDEGEGIRYWIVIQNDGSQSDTITVTGCRGNRTFEVNRVLLGKHKRQDAGAEDLTRRYKAGTLTFTLDPNKRKVFTLNIITHFNKNVTYDCVTLFTGGGGEQDAVVAEMTTF